MPPMIETSRGARMSPSGVSVMIGPYALPAEPSGPVAPSSAPGDRVSTGAGRGESIMCHDDDSRAPAPPVRGEVAAHGGLTLTSADGTVFSAYEAIPAGFQAGTAGMVVLPDVRGLHPYYMDLAQRFAEAGIPAVAIDYFGRTAGTTARDDEFEYMPHVQQVDPDNVRADVAAAIERL